MDIAALAVELTTDTLARGYAGMTNQQAADSLNTINRTGPERTIIPSYEIIDATVPGEWATLTATEKQRYQTITGAGQVNIKNANTRAALAAMFGVGTTTRSNLIALQAGSQISRAEELGLGTVGDGHVASARGT